MCHFEIQNLTNMSVHTSANTIALDAVTTLRLADVNWSALKIAAKQGLRSSFQGGQELALSGVDFARNLTISSSASIPSLSSTHHCARSITRGIGFRPRGKCAISCHV